MWICIIGLEVCDGIEFFFDIRDLLRVLDFIFKYEDDVVFVLCDFYLYLKDLMVIWWFCDLNCDFKWGSSYWCNIVFLFMVLSIFVEIEKDLVVIDFDLSKIDEIGEIVDKLFVFFLNLFIMVWMDPEVWCRVIEAMLGLIVDEVENVFFKSFIRI